MKSSIKAWAQMPREKHLETCLVISTGMVVLWWWKHWEALLYVAVAVGIIGLFFGGLARWLNVLWYGLAELLGSVMSKVVLGIVFFAILTPLGLLSRLRKQDPLQRQRKDSYWTVRSHTFGADDLKWPW